MKKIVQDGEHEALRTESKLVPAEMFGTDELRKILIDMNEALRREHDGVAIAAPQIGVPYQIFLVSPKVFKNSIKERLVYINPKITKFSKDKAFMQEGCLSVRWLYGEVLRSVRVSIEAFDEDGKKFERGASGLLAQIFQHETDHLHATLFIDKAINLEKLPEEDIVKLEAKNERN